MKWFYNMKTKTKLISAFVITAIISGIVGVFGFVNMSTINQHLNDMYNIRLLPVYDVSKTMSDYQRMRVNLLSMHNSVSQEDVDYYYDRMMEFRSAVDGGLAAYAREFANQEHAQLYQRTLTSWEDFKKSLEQAANLSLEGQQEEFLIYLDGEYRDQHNLFNDNLDALLQYNLAEAQAAQENGQTVYESSWSTTIIIVVGAVILSVVLGYLISQVIARPLRRVVDMVGRVAEGDLTETTNIGTKDEIGQLGRSIDQMVLKLRAIVGEILASAESVAAASQQISSSTEEISAGNNSQAQSVQTMNELFKEFSQVIHNVAESAEQASELANQTVKIAQEGGKIINESVQGMDQISEKMAILSQDSNQIGEIIEVIDEIAEQTNLLALNAAIEAARAGEQGRGFAIVADEVRKLAERSGQSTRQISTIIKNVQKNTEECVTAVESGVSSTYQAGESFEKIISMVNESAHRVVDIASSSEEQAAQSSEILASIESISAATEEAAASSEETATSAQSLAMLAQELNNAMAFFKVNAKGS